MILIAGAPAPIDTSSLSVTEKVILEEKQRSPVTYQYASPEELLFELRLRTATVRAALDLGRSGAVFATLRKSKANPKYWIRTPMGGFQQRPGVASSDAIRDIFINGRMYGFECASAVVIIIYKGVLDMLGDAIFSRHFNNLLLMTTNADRNLGLRTIKTSTEMYPGDVLYFSNPDYNRETPEWSGENVILVGPNAYFGHGIGVKPGEGIIADLNRLRRRWALRSAYLMDQTTFPNFSYLYNLSISNPAASFYHRSDAKPIAAAAGAEGAAGPVIRIRAQASPDSAVPFS